MPGSSHYKPTTKEKKKRKHTEAPSVNLNWLNTRTRTVAKSLLMVTYDQQKIANVPQHF